MALRPNMDAENCNLLKLLKTMIVEETLVVEIG